MRAERTARTSRSLFKPVAHLPKTTGWPKASPYVPTRLLTPPSSCRRKMEFLLMPQSHEAHVWPYEVPSIYVSDGSCCYWWCFLHLAWILCDEMQADRTQSVEVKKEASLRKKFIMALKCNFNQLVRASKIWILYSSQV